MEGVQLGARFSLATNRLSYCGPENAEPLLYRAITRNLDLEAAGESLLKFEALAPYLQAIAHKHGLKPLDYRVVEAYWIGNSLLDAFDREDFKDILMALVRRGLPRRLAERMIDRLPSHPLPHHAFHVCFVGVGNVTGHVETTVQNMESCRPAGATVDAIEGEHLWLSKPSLRADRGSILLGDPERVRVHYDPLVLPHLRKGARVALHWGWPAVEMDEGQARAHEHYSRVSLEMANESLPR